MAGERGRRRLGRIKENTEIVEDKGWEGEEGEDMAVIMAEPHAGHGKPVTALQLAGFSGMGLQVKVHGDN